MRAFHPEDKARSAIDTRLAVCGWLVQSRDEMNLSAGTGVAVREFATASGPVDYALFVDKRFCGVVEAKPAGTTLSGFSEQAARYIADAPDFLGANPRQRRFEYVASDTETLFRDLADPEPRSGRGCGPCRRSSPMVFVSARSRRSKDLNTHWPAMIPARSFR
jgi:type I restriction enzyme R subunit